MHGELNDPVKIGDKVPCNRCAGLGYFYHDGDAVICDICKGEANLKIKATPPPLSEIKKLREAQDKKRADEASK